MAADGTDEKYRAPALDKGLDILELLAAQPKGMTRSEIVKSLGRSSSEIYRMLERLVIRGYVNRSIEGDRFALSIKLFQLGATFPPVRRIVDRAQPLMDAFARECLQSIHLAVPDRGKIFVVAQATSHAAWEFRLRLGAELDLLTTGSGQTFLAFSSSEERQNLLAEVNDRAVPDTLADDLSEILNDGHRIRPSQQLIGVTDISVPVFTNASDPVGVLTCPFLPRVDQQDQQVEECLDMVLETAQKIRAPPESQ